MSFAAKFFSGRREEPVVVPKVVHDRLPPPIEDELPQAIEDKVIKDKLYLIFDRIEEHIENFYTTEIPIPPIRHSRPDRYTNNSSDQSRVTTAHPHESNEHHMNSVAQNFPDSKMLRLWMMKMVARLLVTAISPYEDDYYAGAFLPKDLFFFLVAVEEPERRLGDAGYQSIFGHWKAFSSYLLNHPSVKEDNARDLERRYQTKQNELIDEIDTFFETLYDPNDGNRIRHLKQLMRQTADFGILLWSQVAQFQFDWGSDAQYSRAANTSSAASANRRRRTRTAEGDVKKRRSNRNRSPIDRPSTVYMPGLIKLTDHRGRLLNPVKCILEPRRETLPSLSKRATEEMRVFQPLPERPMESIARDKGMFGEV